MWAQWVQASATIVATIGIAATAAYIGFRQWRTAHEKVMLDLFDRRMNVYIEISHVIANIMRSAHVDRDVIRDYRFATARIEFLFGDEVVSLCNDMAQVLNRLDYDRKMLAPDCPIDDKTKYIDSQAKGMDSVNKFPKQFHALAMPYMRMQQRNVRN
jgi:hypothetical protein